MRKNKKNKKKKNCLLVILGPTASGKSDLAVKLARRFNGEVVSADSRQGYKGLDIGTGKITKKEMHGVPHHLLDVASPNHIFTAAEYQKLGKRALRNIWRRGKLPIICGGTGFYIDTLLYEYKLPGTKPNAALREKLEKLSADSLYEKLKKLDQARALTIDRHNKRRLIRALEIIAATGKPVPPPPPKTSPYFYLKIGIKKNEFELSGQIKKRLIKGLRTGLIGEVRGLLKSGVSMRRLDELGLEYALVARFPGEEVDFTPRGIAERVGDGTHDRIEFVGSECRRGRRADPRFGHGHILPMHVVEILQDGPRPDQNGSGPAQERTPGEDRSVDARHPHARSNYRIRHPDRGGVGRAD